MEVKEETQQVAAKARFVLPVLHKGRFQPVFGNPSASMGSG